MPGRLAVVSTPIGNLEDITLRALRTLREAVLIAAEDTRRTRRLLTHYEIRTPMVSVHEHNERARVGAVLARLEAGELVALVSDAGTPLVSDPGAQLVRAALEAGHAVEAIPGPSAVTTALVAAALPGETFAFLGFPPAKGRPRTEWFESLVEQPRIVVFFEAPHRVARTLADLARVLEPSRVIAVCRELTKLHEESVVRPISEIRPDSIEPKGEFTIVVAAPQQVGASETSVSDEQLWSEFCEMTENAGSRRAAVSRLARRYGHSSRAIYQRLEHLKNSSL